MAKLSDGPGSELRALRAAARECGPCSLCCTVLRVDELDKRAGRDCRHQRGREGCGIYDRRPDICRRYACLWRQGGLEEDERPDLTGGVIDLESTGVGVRLAIRVAERGHFERSPALQAIAERHRSEMPVRVSDVDDVMNPDRPFRVLLANGVSHHVHGERIDVYRDGIRVEEKLLPWAERWARRISIWWRNRRLHQSSTPE